MFCKVKLQVFINVFVERFRSRGGIWAVRGVFKHIFRELLWVILSPLTLILHLLDFRQLVVRVEHIGHLSAQPDTLLKELQLGGVKRKKWFLVAPLSKVSNAHLLTYWGLFFPIISNPIAAYILGVMSSRVLFREDLSRYDSLFFGTQPIYAINAQWGARAPLLTLSSSDEDWSEEALIRLGIKSGQWFVGIHVREGGFLPDNELIQSHRNASIFNVIPAMQEIVKRGGVCVRMGDHTMTPLSKMDGVIDYAHHLLKSDRLDVVLCAKARFFLGCTSGLAFLSTSFGVPVAHANMIPIETLGIRYCDISIPKLLWSENLQRYLKFSEIMSLNISGFFFTQQYKNTRIRVDENSSEDILALAKEMLDHLDEVFIECPEDYRMHSEYMALFKPGHYSYGACSRICLEFLRRHEDLLDPAKAAMNENLETETIC